MKSILSDPLCRAEETQALGGVKGAEVHTGSQSLNISIPFGSGCWCSEPWVRKSKWAFPTQIWLDIIVICALDFTSLLLPLPRCKSQCYHGNSILIIWLQFWVHYEEIWCIIFLIQTIVQQSKAKLVKLAWGISSPLFANPSHGKPVTSWPSLHWFLIPKSEYRIEKHTIIKNLHSRI